MWTDQARYLWSFLPNKIKYILSSKLYHEQQKKKENCTALIWKLLCLRRHYQETEKCAECEIVFAMYIFDKDALPRMHTTQKQKNTDTNIATFHTHKIDESVIISY